MCWGWLSDFGLSGTQTTPISIPSAANVSSFSLGPSSLCILRGDGSFGCSGNDDNGQLGDGTFTNKTSFASPLSSLAGDTLADVTQVSASKLHTCLVRAAGDVFCTGYAAQGALGDGQSLPGSNRSRFTPVVGMLPVRTEQGLCADGIDNDSDSLTDGADPDCATALGSSLGSTIVTFTHDGSFGNYWTGTCGGANGPEHMYTWQAPAAGSYKFSTAGSTVDTVLYVRASDINGSQLACNDNSTGTTSEVNVSLTAGQKVFVGLDSQSLTSGSTAQLSISAN